MYLRISFAPALDVFANLFAPVTANLFAEKSNDIQAKNRFKKPFLDIYTEGSLFLSFRRNRFYLTISEEIPSE
jgi:hypothetical protein